MRLALRVVNPIMRCGIETRLGQSSAMVPAVTAVVSISCVISFPPDWLSDPSGPAPTKAGGGTQGSGDLSPQKIAHLSVGVFVAYARGSADRYFAHEREHDDEAARGLEGINCIDHVERYRIPFPLRMPHRPSLPGRAPMC